MRWLALFILMSLPALATAGQGMGPGPGSGSACDAACQAAAAAAAESASLTAFSGGGMIPGTYSVTFTANRTVTLAYLNGGAGGGNNISHGTASNGTDSVIKYPGTTVIATAGGGGGATSSDGSAGSGSTTIVGASTHIGSAGGNYTHAWDAAGKAGGNSAQIAGGSFAVTSGQTMTVIVGASGAGNPATGGTGTLGYNGQPGFVNLSW